MTSLGRLTWERNIWTGNDIASLGNGTRLIRHSGGRFYVAEYWPGVDPERPHMPPDVLRGNGMTKAAALLALASHWAPSDVRTVR